MTNKESMKNVRKGVLGFMGLIFITQGISELAIISMRSLLGLYFVIEIAMFFVNDEK